MNQDEAEFLAALLGVGADAQLEDFFIFTERIPFVFCHLCSLSVGNEHYSTHLGKHARQFSPALRAAFMSAISLGANRYLAAGKVLGMKDALEWQNFFRSEEVRT